MIKDFYKRAGAICHSQETEDDMKERFFVIQERYDELLGTKAGYLERALFWFRSKRMASFKESLCECIPSISDAQRSWYDNKAKILRDHSRNKQTLRQFTVHDLISICNDLQRKKNIADASFSYQKPPHKAGVFARHSS